ncbi:MAG TPA: hypothetical protein VJ441_01265 [Dehalococcoidia bacterium]|nr:hypothetical protein [Dehalococcoidia bacterium]
MRIAMMTPWNVSCGVATHAELVGHQWVKMGHDLKVLAPVEKESQPVTAKDEPYVTRCYTMDREFIKGILKPLSLDHQPFLDQDYELFIVQNLELMPMPELLKLWPSIRKKAATILVIHEGYLPPYPEFYRFDWDAIVCFDERYFAELSKKFSPKRIHVIPYPCHLSQPGLKESARIKLGLPLDKKIVLSYGIAIQQHFVALPVIEELSHIYDLMYLVLPAEGRSEIVERAQARYGFVAVRETVPTVRELYSYLHAADVLLLYKQSHNIVVCSTVYLCAGSGCPIVISQGRYTEALGNEVLKYSDFDELRKVLSSALEGQGVSRVALNAFLNRHAAPLIAQQFIELAQSLRRGKAPVAV